MIILLLKKVKMNYDEQSKNILLKSISLSETKVCQLYFGQQKTYLEISIWRNKWQFLANRKFIPSFIYYTAFW